MHTQIRKLDYTGQKIFAGIDVHKKSWKVSIYSEALYHKTFTQPPRPEVLSSYLRKHFPNATYHSVYEAGFSGYWIHDSLSSLGVENIVVHPADIPTTDLEKRRKTDKVDSNKLAKHLRNGVLSALHTPNRASLEDRSLVRMRRTLVKDLTRFKNRIKSNLSFFGIEIPEQFTRSGFHWSQRFIGWIESLEYDHWTGTASFRVLLHQVKSLREELLETNKELRRLSESGRYNKRVAWLRSISGIGLTTAMIILTEIDDIHRFANQERLRSYVGLTPTSHSSGESEYHGELIHRGNKHLRTVLIESAWVAARVDPVLHMDYINLCKRMKKNKAIVKIACKLLNRVHYVLKNEVPNKSGTN